MTADPTKSVSSAQRALLELRDMIFSGALPAGSDHLETELAERLDMSRTPVREAVLTLEAQGLLALRPRKGVRILPVSSDDMREIYDVLTELESLAAEQAAKMGYTEKELRHLAGAIDNMDAAISADDLDAWALADDHFHTELVRLGGNQRVVMIVSMMRDQVRRARAITLFMRPKPVESNAAHRLVYQSIQQGDHKTARTTHRAHRQQAKDMLVALLERHRLRAL